MKHPSPTSQSSPPPPHPLTYSYHNKGSTHLLPVIHTGLLGLAEFSPPMMATPKSSRARQRICSMSSIDNFSRTITLQRLRRALFSLNEGFSVVAPIKVIVPFSTKGRKVSLDMKKYNFCEHQAINKKWEKVVFLLNIL